MAVPAPLDNNTARHSASARAAAAAARVAARYANAPSYSDLLAGEARAAVRAAEAASKAALEAQAAAESVLAGIEAAAAATEQAWETGTTVHPVHELTTGAEEVSSWAESPVASQVAQQAQWASEIAEFEERWEQEWPVHPAVATSPSAVQAAEAEAVAEDLHAAAWTAPQMPESEDIEMVEPALPIHANLIEFPREIVATRKVRPRLAEGPLAETEDQLSIFEVDPSTVSTEPTAGASDVAAAPGWVAPVWSGIELDATPAPEFYQAPPEARASEIPLEEQLEQAEPSRVVLPAMAPTHLRLMALLVDGSLVVCALLGAALLAGASVREAPSVRVTEMSVLVGFILIGAFYHVLFYALGDGTPGMRYARIFPCRFDGGSPSRPQRIWRLVATLFSVAPLGLGLMWALLDDQHLSWQDRLSQTYLRKC